MVADLNRKEVAMLTQLRNNPNYSHMMISWRRRLLDNHHIITNPFRETWRVYDLQFLMNILTRISPIIYCSALVFCILILKGVRLIVSSSSASFPLKGKDSLSVYFWLGSPMYKSWAGLRRESTWVMPLIRNSLLWSVGLIFPPFCQNLAAGINLTMRGNPLIQRENLICGADNKDLEQLCAKTSERFNMQCECLQRTLRCGHCNIGLLRTFIEYCMRWCICGNSDDTSEMHAVPFVVAYSVHNDAECRM